jgi:hypothetical protein
MAKSTAFKRSPLTIAVACFVALALIVINGLYLIAERIPQSQAERSIALAPWRGQGYSDAAVDILSDPKAASLRMPQIRSLALNAIMRSPLETGAYYALVRVFEAEGKNTLADRLASATEDLSRHDPNVQMYLTSRAAAKNDVGGVMRHLNVVLRTSRSGRSVAFPILCNALTDARSISLVARNMRDNANWVIPFVEQCSSSAPTVGNLARTLLEAPEIARDALPRVHVNILANLVQQKKLSLAGRYYAMVTRAPSDKDGKIMDRFDRIDELPHFDWVATADGGVYIDQLGTGGVAVSTDTSLVPLMERLHTLAPGRYRLVSQVKDLELPARAELFWTVQCFGADASLAVLPLRASRRSQAITFDVPDRNCEGQQLRLRSDGAGQSREITAEIPFVRIEPTNRAVLIQEPAG